MGADGTASTLIGSCGPQRAPAQYATKIKIAMTTSGRSMEPLLPYAIKNSSFFLSEMITQWLTTVQSGAVECTAGRPALPLDTASLPYNPNNRSFLRPGPIFP